MDYLALLQQIFEVCVIPLLAVLTTYLVKMIQKKTNEITQKTDNEMAEKYTKMISETITNCVKTTNQTYVDSLKDKNIFDEDEQKLAFKKTYLAVMDILSQDAIKYINETFGDFQQYLTAQIEAAVNENK